MAAMSDIYSIVPKESEFLDTISKVVDDESHDKNSNYWFLSVPKEDVVIGDLCAFAFDKEWIMQYAIIFDSFDESTIHLFIGLKGTRHLRVVKKIAEKYGLDPEYRVRFKNILKSQFRGVVRGGCHHNDLPVPFRGIYLEIFPEDEKFIKQSHKSFFYKVL